MNYLPPKLRTFLRARQRIENWPTAVGLRLCRGQKGIRALAFRNGINTVCRPGTQDWEVIAEILLLDGYARAFDYLKGLSGTAHVLDLGANLGAFSLAAAAVNPGVQVTAFEPAPPTANLFRINHLANPALQDRIKLEQCGVGGSERTARFFYDARNPQSASLYNEQSTAFEVKIRSFREVVESVPAPVALAKLDVEGAEFEIVRDTPPEVWQRVAAIAIELHEGMGGAVTSAQVLETFASYGYAVERETFGTASYFLHRR